MLAIGAERTEEAMDANKFFQGGHFSSTWPEFVVIIRLRWVSASRCQRLVGSLLAGVEPAAGRPLLAYLLSKLYSLV